ncbi:MAG: hypothetical protein ACR2OO_10570 [Thermomicrobiales bacterium]
MAIPLLPAATAAATKSPASGHASVVAQGVDTLPAGDVVWLIQTRKVASDKDTSVSGGAGFLAPTTHPVFVTDKKSGTESSLEPGEAVFVRGGATSRARSEEADPADLLSMLLADAGSAASGGATVAFTSKAFPAPSGRHDLSLVRDVLGNKEHANVANGGLPALIYAVAGAVAVKNANGGTVEVAAGKAATLNGPLTVTATGAGAASFLIGVIGPEIAKPAPSGSGSASAITPQPTAPPVVETPVVPAATVLPSRETPAADAGTVTLVLRLCPVGVSDGSHDLGGCEVTTDLPSGCELELSGTPIANAFLYIEQTTKTQDGWVWGSLPDGDYLLKVISLPDGYADASLDHANRTIANGSAETAVVYLYRVPATTVKEKGSLTIHGFACDPGVTAAEVGSAVCGVNLVANIRVDSAALDAPLFLIGSNLNGPGYTGWSDLPFGSYVIHATSFAEPWNDYVVEGPVTGGDAVDGYTVEISAASPDVDVQL